MELLSIAVVLAACLALAGATGSLPLQAALTLGGFFVLGALITLWNMRRQASGMTKLSRHGDLTQFFESQLQSPIHGYAVAECAVVDLERPPIPIGHRSFNAFFFWVVQAPVKIGSRMRRIKGPKGSLARSIAHDDGFVYLVVSASGLSMWRMTYGTGNDGPPVFLRSFARGTQIAGVSTKMGGAKLFGRYIIRLDFADGSRVDFWGHDLERAAAFSENAGPALMH